MEANDVRELTEEEASEIAATLHIIVGGFCERCGAPSKAIWASGVPTKCLGEDR